MIKMTHYSVMVARQSLVKKTRRSKIVSRATGDQLLVCSRSSFVDGAYFFCSPRPNSDAELFMSRT